MGKWAAERLGVWVRGGTALYMAGLSERVCYFRCHNPQARTEKLSQTVSGTVSSLPPNSSNSATTRETPRPHIQGNHLRKAAKLTYRK